MDFSSNFYTNLIAFVSLTVSGLLSFFYFRDRKHIKFQLGNDYSKQIMEWYSETIEVLILLKFKTKKDDDEKSFTELLSKLSALIERGRFFFPNVDKEDGFGEEKPIAYKGYRNLTLDFLVAAFNLYNNPTSRKNNLDQAEQLNRHFTSIIFEVIRPKENLKQIKSITDRYYVKEEIFEDFINKKDPSILKFIWKHNN